MTETQDTSSQWEQRLRWGDQWQPRCGGSAGVSCLKQSNKSLTVKVKILMEIVQHLSCDYSIALSCQNDNRKAKSFLKHFNLINQCSFYKNWDIFIWRYLQYKLLVPHLDPYIIDYFLRQDFISLCNVDVKRFTAPFREVISPLLFIPVFIPRDICNNGEKYQRKLFDLKLPAWSKIISEDWFPADRVCKTGWDRKFHNYFYDKD